MTSTARIAGHDVSRIAFGSARLTHADGWGRPADPAAARRLLLQAVDLGYNHIDTADSLGPAVAEQIIGEAVGARPDVLVATKVGMIRPGPARWGVLGHPDYLRHQVWSSLFRLGRDRIDLVYLHRVDPHYPLADQLGALADLRQAGAIGHIGLCEPTPAQLDQAHALVGLAAVQSHHNLVTVHNEPVAELARRLGIPFVAYWALVGHGLTRDEWRRLQTLVTDFARRHGLDQAWRTDEPDSLAALTLAAWALADRPGASILAGSRRLDHLRQLQAVLHHPLDPAAAADLRARAAATGLDGAIVPPSADGTHVPAAHGAHIPPAHGALAPPTDGTPTDAALVPAQAA